MVGQAGHRPRMLSIGESTIKQARTANSRSRAVLVKPTLPLEALCQDSRISHRVLQATNNAQAVRMDSSSTLVCQLVSRVQEQEAHRLL